MYCMIISFTRGWLPCEKYTRTEDPNGHTLHFLVLLQAFFELRGHVAHPPSTINARTKTSIKEQADKKFREDININEKTKCIRPVYGLTATLTSHQMTSDRLLECSGMIHFSIPTHRIEIKM